jgi:hypothetical protein
VVSEEISDRMLEIVSESVAKRVIEICAIDAYLDVAMDRAESFQPHDVETMKTRLDELFEELAVQETAILLNWGIEGLERVTEASMVITGDIGHP